jgi:Tol biopolymer transport system component
MNLDVAPDGNEIVFDLLGDIYSVSSAGGGDNCWVMDRDRKNAKQITKEDFRLLNNAV